MEPKYWCEWLGGIAAPVCREYGLRASVCIAQAAVESAYGERPSGRNNIFGRKWVEGQGSYTSLPTTEYIEGRKVKTLARFRDYDSVGDAIRSYCQLLTGPRYRTVPPLYRDLPAYIRELGRIYATDPLYAGKVMDIIDRFGLTRFD